VVAKMDSKLTGWKANCLSLATNVYIISVEFDSYDFLLNNEISVMLIALRTKSSIQVSTD